MALRSRSVAKLANPKARTRTARAVAPNPVVLDGERILVEGKDEIVLRCGEASITLRRNGRVIIRGLDVVTHSGGRNRIRGAVVSIN